MPVFVEEVMHDNLITVRQNQTLLEALHLAKANRIRHLPVVDGEQLVGIVSDRDLRDVSPSVLLKDSSKVLQDTKVAQIMTREVVTVHPLDYLEDAARLMYDHRIGCLPVVSDNRLVGIISETDLLRALIELTGSTEAGSTLVVRVPERYGPLAEVTQIIKRHKVSISSCFIRPDRSSNYRLISMRVKTINPAGIIQEIRAAGYEVQHPTLGEDNSE